MVAKALLDLVKRTQLMKHPEKVPIHLVTIQMVVKDHQVLDMIQMILH